ncbi:hypothetical protein ACSMXN_12670 [Jatrophihabitans sp. DSM 45814]
MASALFGAIDAVLDLGALWFAGRADCADLGLLSVLTNFVPNMGFVLGVVPPALLALLDHGWQFVPGPLEALLAVAATLLARAVFVD